MFERIAPTEADRDAEAALGRSPDQVAALRLAAMLIVVNVLAEIAVVVALRIPGFPVFRVIIGCIVAFYLYRLRPRAETFAQGVAVVGSVLAPVLYLANRVPVADAVISSLPVWGVSAAVLMLLTGDPSRARRIGAVAVFVIFTIGSYFVLVAVALILRGGSSAPPV